MRYLLLLMVVGCLFISSCCDDCPTCPVENDDVTHYKAYAWTLSNQSGFSEQYLYTLNLPADSVIDSTLFPFNDDVKLLADSVHLICKSEDLSQYYIYNLTTNEIDSVINLSGNVLIDFTRNIMLITAASGTYKFDATTFKLLDSSDNKFLINQLDTLNGYIYGNYINNPSNQIFVYDYVSMSVIDSFSVGEDLQLIYDLLPIPEYNKLYLIGLTGSTVGTFVYDKNTESLSLIKRFSTFYGKLYRYGNYVYNTDPGNSFYGIAGSYLIWVYNLETDFIDRTYSTIIESNSEYNKYEIDRLSFSPDGIYFYGIGRTLVRYNLITGESKDVFEDIYPMYAFELLFGEEIE